MARTLYCAINLNREFVFAGVEVVRVLTYRLNWKSYVIRMYVSFLIFVDAVWLLVPPSPLMCMCEVLNIRLSNLMMCVVLQNMRILF